MNFFVLREPLRCGISSQPCNQETPRNSTLQSGSIKFSNLVIGRYQRSRFWLKKIVRLRFQVNQVVNNLIIVLVERDCCKDRVSYQPI